MKRKVDFVLKMGFVWGIHLFENLWVLDEHFL